MSNRFIKASICAFSRACNGRTQGVKSRPSRSRYPIQKYACNGAKDSDGKPGDGERWSAENAPLTRLREPDDAGRPDLLGTPEQPPGAAGLAVPGRRLRRDHRD